MDTEDNAVEPGEDLPSTEDILGQKMETICWTANVESNQKEPPRFRVILSQVVAVTCINFILLDLGMVLALPTIVIPELQEHSEELEFTEDEASWLGSLAFIFQPVGSAISGLVFESLGRRTTMLFVNVPLLVGWLFMWFGTQVRHFYIGQIIMGMSIGLTDAPHITYLGEISQPQWRGILISYAELCVAFGFCVVFFLGSVAHWRTVATVCCAIPVASMLFIAQIPESPVWLLAKGRKNEAVQSLGWLRGWVNPRFVRDEFAELQRHQEETEPGGNRETRNENRSFFKKLMISLGCDDILRKSVRRPILLVALYFGFSHFAGVTNTRPFMVDILNEFQTPLDPIWEAAISSIVGIAGLVTGMIVVPKAGKRFVSLLSMLGCAVTTGCISMYVLFIHHINVPWIPVFLFILLNFIWSCGIGQIPWMLISEVFPFRGRAVASGVVAAISYVEAFISIKTYYTLLHRLSMPGVFGFFTIISLIGSLFLYIFLPETEGKTLKQVETILEDRFERKLNHQKKRRAIELVEAESQRIL